MAKIVALILVASSTIATAFVADRHSNFLAADMRPDVVAKLMVSMQEKWQAQAYAFTGCETTKSDFNCKQAPEAFGTSCGQILSAIVSAGSGNSENAKEYMNQICSNTPGEQHKATCATVGQAVTSQMSADDVVNRESAPAISRKGCHKLWLNFVDGQTAKRKQEIAASKAREQEEAERAAKEAKEAEAKALAEKKAMEEAEEQAKAKEEAEIEESKKRLADAKSEVDKSLDQQKAKIQTIEKQADEKIQEAVEVVKDDSTLAEHAWGPPKDGPAFNAK